MAIDKDATEQEKRRAETLQNTTEQSRYFVSQETQRTVQDRQRWAEAIKSAAEKASQLAYTQSQQHAQTLDDRGKITPDPVQQTMRHEQVADGITVSTVLAAHLANKGAQYIHQQQEQRIQQAVNQPNDPVLEKQNQIREEVLKNDLAQQETQRQNQSALQFEQAKNSIAEQLRQESINFQQQNQQEANNQLESQYSNVAESVNQTHETSIQQNKTQQEIGQSQSAGYDQQVDVSKSNSLDIQQSTQIDNSQGISR